MGELYRFVYVLRRAGIFGDIETGSHQVLGDTYLVLTLNLFQSRADCSQLCLVHVIFDELKFSSNLESLFSFKLSPEQKSDRKEYKSLLMSFEALSLLS
jgi:hypothetical protein